MATENVSYPTSTADALPLATRLATLATADPDRPAVTCGDLVLTRVELDRRSNILARHYASLGVGFGSVVTLLVPNSAEFLLAAVAIWKLGATPQPVSPRLPAAELSAIVELADPTLVVGAEPGTIDGRPCVPAGLPLPDTGGDALPALVAPVWKALTSGGSTGRPKLILAGQPATAELMDLYATVFRMPSDGVHLVTGPLTSNAPFLLSAAALFTGSHVVVMPRFDPDDTLALISRHRVEWLMLVPTMMHRIHRLPGRTRRAADLSSLRVVLHGAAPCPGWLKRAWLDWVGPDRLFELYATTEAMAACLISGREWLERPGSVGRPVSGEISVRDAGGAEVPWGTEGEIWMRAAPGTAATYAYRGAEAVRDPDGWETHGDCGRLDEDGYLYLSGRKQDMILVGGLNVYPAEIEAALDEHPLVASSAVIGLPDDEYGNVVHAIVQGDDPVDDETLLAHLRERLAPNKLPRGIEWVATPLRDDAGKVRRAQLRAERLAVRS